MKRLFLGIPLNSQLIDLCSSFITAQKIDVRWVPEHNWHITLVFLGDFPAKKIQSLSEHLAAYFEQENIFELLFSGFHYQPDGKYPRMIWGNFQPSGHFDNLVQNTAKELDEFYQANDLKSMPAVRNKNIPHITLSRLKKNFARQPLINQFMENQARLQIDNCKLFESQLLTKGAQYKILHDFSIGSQTKKEYV